jgi:nicotinate-nucleotide pyrophosphorylase (carboxylating)
MASTTAEFAALVDAALAEDLGAGDWTTECTVPATHVLRARVVAKASGVVAGTAVAALAFTRLAPECRVEIAAPDGSRVAPGDVVLRLDGPARAILSGERVALNFLQRLSGIATLTARYVAAVEGTGAVVSDTRKTTPLLRGLEKHAVRCGGGTSHRSGLDAMLLVKENHIAAAGSLERALAAALACARERGLEAEVEVRTWAEFEAALAMHPHRILLDHWTPEAVARAAAARGAAPPPQLEVSGNLNLDTVARYARAGAEVLSVGALTHSAPALDLSLLVQGAEP